MRNIPWLSVVGFPFPSAWVLALVVLLDPGKALADVSPQSLKIGGRLGAYFPQAAVLWASLALAGIMAGVIVVLLIALASRKQALAALGESQARYQGVVENAPAAIFTIDAAGRFLDVNPKACRLTGYDREELLDLAIGDILDQESRQAVAAYLADFKEGSRIAEVSGRRRDGAKRWWSVSAVRLDRGRILGFAADVTDRRRRDDVRLVFYELVQNAKHVVVFKDRDLRYVMVNRAYQHLTGHRLEAVVGKTDPELFKGLSAPEQIARYVENDRRALALPRGRTLASEEEMRGRAGRVRIFLTKKFPVYAEDGRLLGVATMASEITERKRVEARLRESESRYRLLAELAPISIMAFDAAGRITFVNRRHLDTFAGGQQDRDHCLGRRITELPGVVRAGIADKLTPLLEGREVDLEAVHSSEFTGDHAGYVNLRGVPLVRDDGSLAGGILIREDVTARIEMERTLTAARNEAQAASRAKSEFLANMSHEIRTPLNGVLGMLQLLRDTPLNAEQAEYADLAVQSSRRLTRLLADILDLSRVEAGKMVIQCEPLELARVVTEAVELFKPSARQAGVELTVYVDAALPARVAGDAARLQQVLANLVGNALKFTAKGSVAVEAYPLPPRREGEERALFSVADTGCGIADADLLHLFEPFVQGSRGYSRNAQGAGLGLAICKSLVELMGGTIAVDSEVGRGTTVFFCCSFSAGGPAGQAAAPGAGQAAPDGLRVLVAEDDRITRLAVRRLLEKEGHAVVEAVDGLQALETLLRGDPFDLVLMDIQMPGIDGVQAVRAMRDDPRYAAVAGLPVVALTAYAMAGDRETFLAAGMDAYVAKPVFRDELRRAMEDALAAGRARKA